MGLLSQLSRVELAAVAFHAQQLSMTPAARDKGSSSRQAKPGKKGSAGKPGPAQLASKYSTVPEYTAFKAAERPLSALLKSRGCTLKVLEEKDADNPVLKDFLVARSQWFRTKAALSVQPVAPIGSGSPPEAEASSSSSSTSSSSFSSSTSGSTTSGSGAAQGPASSAKPKKKEDGKKPS